MKRLIDYFKVKDVHGILFLTVYDEDKNHKSEFLGKIAVPLLKMEVRTKFKACKDIHCVYRRPNSIKAFIHTHQDLIWAVRALLGQTMWFFD